MGNVGLKIDQVIILQVAKEGFLENTFFSGIMYIFI